jgi:Asp-tRNA(Asn)/Glu-tRNA(Gln) amidotransferase A subunit family amidase
MTQPLYALGLADAASAIARGEITAEAFTASCLERIHALEPEVQAWVWRDDERALAAARAADRRRARVPAASDDPADALAPVERGRLPGLPVGIKDLIDVAGMPSGMGSPIYAGYRPARSAALVERMARSGAYPLGKTVTTEFAFMVPAKTRNPWNTGHTPGGSSSGSAAAVACGMVPAAIGTQTNGSVIRPAVYCGVVGYKPGAGRIAIDGVLPFSTTFDTPGVFARSVTDAALLASWLTRRDGVIGHRIAPLRTGPRLAAVRSPVWERAEPAQRERFAADIDRLRAAGATVTERALPAQFDDALRLHRAIMLYEAAAAARVVRASHRDAISEFLNRALDEGDATTEATYREALVARTRLIRSLIEFFGDDIEAIVTPPATGEAPAGLGATGDPAFCSLWSLLGVPAIVIPTGLGPRGLPLGLQIVTPPGASNTLLAVAAWCEARSPFRGLIAGGATR